MDDIYKSIRAFLYERASSPLFGAFVVSWLICNYRIVLIIFDDASSFVKFSLIDGYFSSKAVAIFSPNFILPGEVFSGVFIPALLAALYLYAYPYLGDPVYEFWLERQKRLRGIRQRSEGERVLSLIESRELFKKIAELQSKYDEDVDFYRRQVDALANTIKELEGGSPLRGEGSGESADELETLDYVLGRDESARDELMDRVSDFGDKPFIFRQLLTEDEWDSMSAESRAAAANRFKDNVKKGVYPGVGVHGKNNKNEQLYLRNEMRVSSVAMPARDVPLSEEEEKALIAFVGLPDDVGLSSKHISAALGVSIDRARYLFESLEEKGLINAYVSPNDGERLARLHPSGRKYLARIEKI